VSLQYKAIPDATHPGAKLKRPDSHVEASSLAAAPSQEELLSALGAEADDEEGE
jgi:hypothetical protein